MKTMSDESALEGDPLAALCEQVLTEGGELGVSPDVLMQVTAEAFDFLFDRRLPDWR